MKKLESLEKYVQIPDTSFYGAYFYNGEDIELHNETNEVDGIELTIIDTIENGIFKKHKILKVKSKDLVEETTITYPIKKNQMLVFIQNRGFMEVEGLIPLDEAIERLKLLDSKYWEGDTHDFKRNKNKDI